MTKKRGSVLICGASIAGPTLAFWLDRFGYDVTLVELGQEAHVSITLPDHRALI
jgi:2-polyprenyl-6-methoxyphenol hydroxylase-like FAD-dependent oxidoreductase